MDRIVAGLASVLLLYCFYGIAALEDENRAGGEVEEERPKILVETELVDVRVVVTDKSGRIVEDLDNNDFILLEDDEPQEISHFSVSKIDETQQSLIPKEEAATDEAFKLEQVRRRLTQPPVRTILLYVDALHLSFSSLNWVKQTLQRFIEEQMTEQDLVAFTSSETLGVAQQFTRDRRILRSRVNCCATPSVSLLENATRS